MTYRIRRVDPDDFHDELMEMQRVCLPNSAPIEFNGADDADDWWLAFVDDVPAGFASMRPSVAFSLTGYLSRAGVAPEFRGNGLQKRLIRARESFARRHGWQWLVTDSFNPVSANNLMDCGYRAYAPAQPWAFAYSTYWRRRIADDVPCETPS